MKTVLKNGIFAFIGIGVYFLIAELLGFSKSTPLRLLNFFILGFFVNKTIVHVKKSNKTFVVQFTHSLLTSILTVFLSTIALAFYLYLWKGSDYINSLSQPLLNMGALKLSMLQFSFAIFTEGIASGIILSFGLMQFWKNRKLE
ncbi:MAG: hypothetical protein CMP67_03325 [Flavobacteriales bacterium]|nr:hypothetical protein [Flavobacteriales bacterium]MBO73020.1 hypothetical protein [Flavobacteriales bacterium]|tara:strand:+ start:130 stop:561 length:432 start_codon:yes stop_codon:yes gene_type:complete